MSLCTKEEIYKAVHEASKKKKDVLLDWRPSQETKTRSESALTSRHRL